MDTEIRGAQQLMQESRESTKRSLSILDQTLDLGCDTATELERQGEQIKRINAKVDYVHENMQASDRLLRSLNAWFGLSLTNAFTSDKPRGLKKYPFDYKPNEKNSAAEKPSSRSPGVKETESKRTTSAPSLFADPGLREWEEETDRDLDEIYKRLVALGELGKAIGEEVNAQTEDLDALNENVTRANLHVKHNLFKTKNLLS